MLTGSVGALCLEQAKVERRPRATGGVDGPPPAQQLLALLELSLGNPTVARAAVAHALSLAGRDELPTSAGELLGFVRVHLVSILTNELGARLTMALLDDLEERLDPAPADSAVRVTRGMAPTSSAPPASLSRRIAKLDFRPNVTPLPAAMLGVLVVDPDPIGRPVLARALLRAKWGVTVADSPAEVAIAFDNGEDIGVALVHADHPKAEAILLEVVARYPAAAVVARGRDTSSTHARLTALGISRLDVRTCDAPPEELVDAIRRALGV